MALRNIFRGSPNSRNHPVNTDREKKAGMGVEKQFFRLDAQKQVLALNHPIHLGSVNLACVALPVVQKSYMDFRKEELGY